VARIGQVFDALLAQGRMVRDESVPIGALQFPPLGYQKII
jgi:hypothetical protein